MNLDPYLTLNISINLKWIRNLNIRAKTRKFVGGKIDINLLDFGLD